MRQHDSVDAVMVGARPRSPLLTLVPVAVAALLLAGCATPGGPEVAVVEITENGFSPATLIVAPGTEVRWTNSEPRAHTVTSGGDLLPGQQPVPGGAAEFDSGRLLEGEAFAHVFEVPGEHYYECEYHGDEEQMVGTIRVEQP
ncbi:cupredoxin domain-containing protein [Citricoccus alkalitolerans]|uniref:Plastocyanin/azurin family copper-binding protein n=1 Tax=Citricoccus alkalitolerans TaxID=246603 RepID=A0ABV8XXE7_9MICC